MKILKELPANSSAKQLVARKHEAATLQEVGYAIALCEALSQVKKLTDEQRKALQIELYNKRFSRDELFARAKSVALNPNREFGNIGLRWWLEDTLVSKRELDAMVEHRLNIILAEGMLRIVKPDAQEVHEEALSRLQYEVEQQHQKEFEEELARTRERFKKYVDSIANSSQKRRERLYAEAVKLGIFAAGDKHIVDNLHKPYIAIRLFRAGIGI